MKQLHNKLQRFITIMVISFSLVSCSSETAIPLSPLSEDAVILAFGDSLTFGTGADNSNTQSYPAVLEQLIGRTVVNSGIPGERSAEGLIRLAEELDEYQPNLVILCHGGNDLIQRLSKQKLKQNLEKMVSLIQASGAEVVLMAVPTLKLSLQVPPLYSEVAQSFNLPVDLETFRDVESSPSLKSDPIHPNSTGYKQIAVAVQQLLLSSGAI
ncbi:hypothetical protein A9Q78_07305 [Methylophaga sp. 41_12_T18]|nr:hypothetical protein A9Q78_07305 [Methylophaga sp. 41_12_T18]